jgi:signal transduction histidine kinase
MATFIDQVLTILTTSPGNLTYHLVLAFTIAATFQVSLPLVKREEFPQGRRLLTGLALLLLARLLLFFVSIWAWQSVSPLPDTPFAILDRAITALSLVIIVWLLAFPEPSHPADNAFTLLGLLTIILFILSLIWWSNNGQLTPFNSSLADVLWQTFTIFLIYLGGMLLVVHLPVGWGIAMVFLGIMFGGHLIHLVSPMPDSDYPGIVRLAQMAAYPLLFFLPQRYPLTYSKHQATSLPVQNSTHNTLLDEKTIQSIRDLATKNEPTVLYQSLTHTIAHLISVDACLLISTNPHENRITVEYGYDFIREETMPESSIEFYQAPFLAKAINIEQPLRMPANDASVDQISLGSALDLSTSGPFLAVPLLDTNGNSNLGIVLLSPYSQREWDEVDQDFLINLIASFSPALIRTRQFQKLEDKVKQARQAVQNVEAQARETSQLNENLIAKLSALQEIVSQEKSRSESLAALISTQFTEKDDIADLIQKLKLELSTFPQELQTELADNGAQSVQQGLRLALEAITRLRSSLSTAEKRIQTLETSPSTSADINERTKTITNITQEFYLPLSSIVGYTEVLLTSSSESLNTSQKKLLERIKTSTQRLTSLLEELAQLTEVSGQGSTAQPLSLLALIEESIAFTHHGIRRKTLSLQTDIPEKLPQVLADRQVLRQLIMRLIQEAITATPSGGSITILVRDKEVDIPPDHLLLQISDNSPGVPPAELSQVFSSSEFTDKASPGDNNSNLPLSTLKRLFEAQGCRIWVDSILEQGTTFSLLLPVYLPSPLAFNHIPGLNKGAR